MVKVSRAKTLIRLTLLDKVETNGWFKAGRPHCVSAATLPRQAQSPCCQLQFVLRNESFIYTPKVKNPEPFLVHPKGIQVPSAG